MQRGTEGKKSGNQERAWRAAGHTTFLLKKGWINLGAWDQMQKFVKVFPDIIEETGREGRCEFFVTVNGKSRGR